MCGSHVSANVEDILWLIVCVYCSFRSYCCYVFLKYAHDCHHRLSEAMQPEQTCPMRRWVSRPIAACMMRTGQTMRMHLAMHPRLLCSRLLTRSLQQKLHLFVSGSTKLCQTCQIKLSRLHLDLNRWKDNTSSGWHLDSLQVQWRLLALSRGLGLPMPRPFRAPYFPGLTVCDLIIWFTLIYDFILCNFFGGDQGDIFAQFCLGSCLGLICKVV